MADDRFEQQLIAKVESLIRLIAISVVEGRKQADQMRILARAGFQPKEIAALIGTTPHTVSVELSKLRRMEARSTRPKERAT